MCHNFTVKNPGRCVSRYEFSKLFSEAWSQAMTIRNIIAGFETTDIRSFNRYVISVLEGTYFQPMDAVKKSNLAYHPWYSPKMLIQPHCFNSSGSNED